MSLSVSLADAVDMAGARPRQLLGLEVRPLQTGAPADLVLFDPAVVADRADFGNAQALSIGIRRVWVNGEIVFADGKTTGAHPGRPLRRGSP